MAPRKKFWSGFQRIALRQRHRISRAGPPTEDGSLWDRAYASLSRSDQAVLARMKQSEGSPVSFASGLNELIDLTNEKKGKCEKALWSINFRGHKIILRDCATKIVFWLDKFKEVGDVAANFSPTTTSLPWAAMRFFLKWAVAEQEQMGALLLATERIAQVVGCWKAYELLYTEKNTNEDCVRALHKSIVQLYADVLVLIVTCHQLLSRNTAARIFNAVVDPDEMVDLLNQIDDSEAVALRQVDWCESIRSSMADAEMLAETKALRVLVETLQSPITRIDHGVAALLDGVNVMRRIELLNWVSAIPYSKYHEEVRIWRTPETCVWLLNREKYKTWQNTSSSMIIWLQGSPGAGKTFLTSMVIDNVKEVLDATPNHEGLAYFYCKRDEEDRRQPLSVLRSYIRQLSTYYADHHHIHQDIKQFYTEAMSIGNDFSLGIAREYLVKLVNSYPKTTIILDALDECDPDVRDQLLITFEQLIDTATRPVKIFISSRPDGDLRERLNLRPNIEIKATDNEDDIAKFVEEQLDKQRALRKVSDGLRDEIVQTLVTQSQGMFQWAALQIQQLSKLCTEVAMRDRLGKMPASLKETYDEIYREIEARHDYEKQLAMNAFMSVMAAYKPLEAPELLILLNPEGLEDGAVSEDQLLELCSNLLVLDSQRSVWRVAHLSVLEYFETHHWTVQQAHHTMAMSCLRWLVKTFDPMEAVRGIEDGTPLQRAERVMYLNGATFPRCFYPKYFWMMHVAQMETYEVVEKDLVDLLKQFLGQPMDSSWSYRNWILSVDWEMTEATEGRTGSTLNSIKKSPWAQAALREELRSVRMATFPMSAFGFHNTLPDWVSHEAILECPLNKAGNSLLSLAVLHQHTRLVRYFIEVGVDVNQPLRNEYGCALALAAAFNNVEIVDILLAAGADPSQKVSGYYGSPLAAACVHLQGEEVVRKILDAGADPNMPLTGRLGSALAMAAWCHNPVAVKLIVEAGADVDAKLEGDLSSALSAAVCRSRKLCRFLIASGADANMPLPGRFGSAAAVAAHTSHTDRALNSLAELCIEGNGDIDMLLGGEFGSVLASAAASENLRAIKVLCAYGASVDLLLPGRYGSALAAAAYNGHHRVVKLLINVGADPALELQGPFENAIAAAEAGSTRQTRFGNWERTLAILRADPDAAPEDESNESDLDADDRAYFFFNDSDDDSD